MNREKLEYFRKLLTERLDALSQEASRTVNDMTEEEENPGDLTDQATVEADTSLLLRMWEWNVRYLRGVWGGDLRKKIDGTPCYHPVH